MARIRAIDVLPTPAGPREEIGVRDAAAGDRVLQRLRDVRLPDDLRKGLRPKPAGQDRVVGAGRIHERGALSVEEGAKTRETKSYLRMHLKANA